ncbi:MAG TPA: beta-ketoacyl-ACP synthase II [Acholeplasmataceae bacterium]|nr:beta-ketoacyl-ACP synthase II [Acholeplasmataceae bacterium]
MKRRVVVTGMGMVTPLGHNVNDTIEALNNGENGIDSIKLFDTSNSKVKIAGEVKDIDFSNYMDRKDVKRSDRFTNLGLVAAIEAYNQADLEKDRNQIDPYRFGTYVASGIGGLNTIFEETTILLEKGPHRMSPFFIPKAIINLLGANISIKFKTNGPNIPIVTACSAATNAIGEAYKAIKDGYLDIAFAGGSEASINELGVGGFASLRALSTNEDPTKASKPFDKNRDGFVIGEGAGILILEEYELAKARGAKILAEIVGYGTTSDANHITAPEETGASVTKAINLAIEDAKIKHTDIGYINAHGTSTELNDKIETLAIKNAFKEHAYNINISSTKSMLGHSLGATGAVESIVIVKALETGIIPPTINYETKDSECDLNYTPNKAVKRDFDYGLNMNLGFGGQNAVLIFKKGE